MTPADRPAAKPRTRRAVRSAPRNARRPRLGSAAPKLRAPVLLCLVACLLALAPGGNAWAQREHVVQPGDTLYALADRYATDVATLRRLNGLEGSLLRVGAVLELPAPARAERRGFRPHLAAPGETLAGIAVATGRSEATLASANPEVAPGEDLGGRLLLVPPADGRTVRAAPGETLADLAGRWGDDPAALAERSGIAPGEGLVAGQPLLLAPATASPAAPPAASTAASTAMSTASPAPSPASTGAGDARLVNASATRADVALPAPRPVAARHARQLELLALAPALLAGLDWSPQEFAVPVRGRITSRYGWRAISVAGNRFHNGLDLGAASGTPVRAARDGVVTEAGWIGSYGYAVYLDHGDGSQTRYAHLSRLDVRRGGFVRGGDVLGAVGSTGASTGPHLHFEIRIDGRSVDPLLYLGER